MIRGLARGLAVAVTAGAVVFASSTPAAAIVKAGDPATVEVDLDTLGVSDMPGGNIVCAHTGFLTATTAQGPGTPQDVIGGKMKVDCEVGYGIDHFDVNDYVATNSTGSCQLLGPGAGQVDQSGGPGDHNTADVTFFIVFQGQAVEACRTITELCFSWTWGHHIGSGETTTTDCVGWAPGAPASAATGGDPPSSDGTCQAFSRAGTPSVSDWTGTGSSAGMFGVDVVVPLAPGPGWSGGSVVVDVLYWWTGGPVGSAKVASVSTFSWNPATTASVKAELHGFSANEYGYGPGTSDRLGVQVILRYGAGRSTYGALPASPNDSSLYTLRTLGGSQTALGASTWPAACSFYWGERIAQDPVGTTNPIANPVDDLDDNTPPPGGTDDPEPDLDDPEVAPPPSTTGECGNFSLRDPLSWAGPALCEIVKALGAAVRVLRSIASAIAGLAADIASAIAGAIGGVLTALFVPSPGFFGDTVDDVKDSWDDTPPGEAAGLVAGLPAMFDVPTSSDCNGPGIPLSMPFVDDGDVVLHLFSTCHSALATLAQVMHTALRVGVWIGAFLLGFRLIASALGYQVELGRGAD